MHRAFVEIDIPALQHNYQLLADRTPNANCMAVVKANAYGHGIELVAPALWSAGCRHFAVTDAHEGSRLRLLLPEAGIMLLAGIISLDEAVLCQRQRLVPVLSAHWQVPLLWQAGFRGEAWLKVDTGMARTGTDDPLALQQSCQKSGIRAVGLLSHLACADTPEHPLNQQQIERFRQWRQRLPELHGSLLNSAGILAFGELAGELTRPGIGLYGAEPLHKPAGLRPVMRFSAPVMQLRSLNKGESVGYGASFTAPEPMRIAIIRAGYADGVFRSLSNGGTVWLNGHRVSLVGRVCMDYCMLNIENTAVREGDRAVFWGAEQNVNAVAEQAGTIAYELLTRVGERVPRIPV